MVSAPDALLVDCAVAVQPDGLPVAGLPEVVAGCLDGLPALDHVALAAPLDGYSAPADWAAADSHRDDPVPDDCSVAAGSLPAGSPVGRPVADHFAPAAPPQDYSVPADSAAAGSSRDGSVLAGHFAAADSLLADCSAAAQECGHSP